MKGNSNQNACNVTDMSSCFRKNANCCNCSKLDIRPQSSNNILTYIYQLIIVVQCHKKVYIPFISMKFCNISSFRKLSILFIPVSNAIHNLDENNSTVCQLVSLGNNNYSMIIVTKLGILLIIRGVRDSSLRV